MAPLEPIDRNINPDWPTLTEVARTGAGNWDDGATTEEEVDEDGDLEGAFELPGRPVSLRNEYHVADREVFDVTTPRACHLISSVNVVCAKVLDAVDAHHVT